MFRSSSVFFDLWHINLRELFNAKFILVEKFGLIWFGFMAGQAL